MDPRELEALAKRLGENANDTEALNAAYAHGQQDPRGYAVFLEKAGGASVDAASGAHWFCEAATVWTTSLNDAHRAERALVRAIDKDPLHSGATERLVAAYNEKSNSKGVAALHARRAKSVETRLAEQPELKAQVAEIYSELARVFTEELQLPDKALESYKKAAKANPEDAYAIYQARELLKGAERWKEALPYFAAEQALVQDDHERRAALYADEIEVCRQAGATNQLIDALRGARAVDTTDDAGIKQQLAATILELVQEGKSRPPEDIVEATALFVELAETYDGEHGHSYSECALGLEPGNDRAAQLAMHYAEQIGKTTETAHSIASYLAANPEGAVAEDARNLVAEALSAGGDERLIAALTPAEDASAGVKAGAFSVIARAMLAQGKEDEARSYYSRVIQASPADETAVAHLAEFMRGSDDAGLRDLLLKAAKVEGAAAGQRQAWFAEVAQLCETTLNDVDGAIEARRQLVLMDPSDEDAANLLEETFEKAEKWDELAELLARRAEYDADPSTQLERELRVSAIHRDHRGDNLAAGEAMARAAKLDPDEEERALSAVDLYVAANQPSKAIEFLQGLLGEMLGEEARSNYNARLGELLEKGGRILEAGVAYGEAAAGADRVELWQHAQECFVREKVWDKAAAAAASRRQLTDDPSEKGALCSQEAEYLTEMGDAEGAAASLKEALDYNPGDAAVAAQLERFYEGNERFGELISLLLSRATEVEDADLRVASRKRAAFLQRDKMQDSEGMRQALLDALEDGEDAECLRVLADDAQAQGDQSATVAYLRRLADCLGEGGKGEVALRLAKLLEEEDDEEGALEQYETALASAPEDVDVLSAVAHLQRSTGQETESAASYEKLLKLSSGEQKLATARCLADLLAELERPQEAMTVYRTVISLDSEDLEAVEHLRDLAETVEDWTEYAQCQGRLVDVEGDEEEAAVMAIKLADVLASHLSKPSEAMGVLVPFARGGDISCREEYERLGDSLGKQGEVAESLIEWMKDAPAGPKRNEGLRGAYERFLEINNNTRAIEVGLELVRMKGADEELAKTLEATAIIRKNVEALQAAFAILGRDMSGPPRAEEMVRQAEILASAGLPVPDSVLHGEQALTSIAPAEAESLLARLATVASEKEGAIGVYERQVTRCKSVDDRISALCRAAEVASEHGVPQRVQRFFEIALQAAGQAEGLDDLRERVRRADEASSRSVLREALVAVLSLAGKGARDGGRSRAAYLARAASVSFEDLKDSETAFQYMGAALVAHADEAGLEQLTQMGEAENNLEKVVSILGETLAKVKDGPLVRMILRRRFELRSDRLQDAQGAGEDLKKLYDLSPADADVAQQLESMYEANEDHRGLVQLFEDQILRGRDQAIRGALAHRVALLWQDTLNEPREAADAWRRVLRMKSGDTEAKEGLLKAKQAMRMVSAEQVAESEEQNRKDVEARRATEQVEIAKREEELQAKAAELQARHSNPPPALVEERPETDEVEIPQDAPLPPGLAEESEIPDAQESSEVVEEPSSSAVVQESSSENEPALVEDTAAAAANESPVTGVLSDKAVSEPSSPPADAADDVADEAAEDAADDVADDVADEAAEDVADDAETSPVSAPQGSVPPPAPSVSESAVPSANIKKSIPPPLPTGGGAPPPPSVSRNPLPPPLSAKGGPGLPPPSHSKMPPPPPVGAGKIPPPPGKIPPPPAGGRPPARASGRPNLPPPPGKKPPPPPLPRK